MLERGGGGAGDEVEDRPCAACMVSLAFCLPWRIASEVLSCCWFTALGLSLVADSGAVLELGRVVLKDIVGVEVGGRRRRFYARRNGIKLVCGRAASYY